MAEIFIVEEDEAGEFNKEGLEGGGTGPTCFQFRKIINKATKNLSMQVCKCKCSSPCVLVTFLHAVTKYLKKATYGRKIFGS